MRRHASLGTLALTFNGAASVFWLLLLASRLTAADRQLRAVKLSFADSQRLNFHCSRPGKSDAARDEMLMARGEQTSEREGRVKYDMITAMDNK